MVTVRVVSQSIGKPAKGRKVAVGFSSMLRGTTSAEYTDSNGEAHFDANPGQGKMYVDGKTAYRSKIIGRVMVYV
jgi:hypothetical protein